MLLGDLNVISIAIWSHWKRELGRIETGIRYFDVLDCFFVMDLDIVTWISSIYP